MMVAVTGSAEGGSADGLVVASRHGMVMVQACSLSQVLGRLAGMHLRRCQWKRQYAPHM